eukprot:4543211-Pleurochrysis_carterae.AAC.1
MSMRAGQGGGPHLGQARKHVVPKSRQRQEVVHESLDERRLENVAERDPVEKLEQRLRMRRRRRTGCGVGAGGRSVRVVSSEGWSKPPVSTGRDVASTAQTA